MTEPRSALKTRDEAVSFVKSYLAAMEARDLNAAARQLSARPVFTFPGGVVFLSLADIVNNSGGRYARIGKTMEHWDAFQGGDCWVVYCRGTLHGEWLNGQAFSGIRFIDRFEIDQGGIRRQDVWNDAAELRPPHHGGKPGPAIG